MDVTPSRPETPSNRLVIPHYEDNPRTFGGRGTLSHLAAPSSFQVQAQVERRLPSARSFSPNYRAKTPLFLSRRSASPFMRPGTADSGASLGRFRTPGFASPANVQGGPRVKTGRPSTADKALREVTRPRSNRPGTADRSVGGRGRSGSAGAHMGGGGFSSGGRQLSSDAHESTSYSKVHGAESAKENTANLKRRPRSVPSAESSAKVAGKSYKSKYAVGLFGISPETQLKRREKNAHAKHTVPVGSLIKAKASNTLRVYKKGIIDVVKDFNSIREDAERKEILLEVLEGKNKELDRQAEYTASVLDPENKGKLKVKTVSRELEKAKKQSQDLGVYHFQLDFVKKRIERHVIETKKNVDHLTSILNAASNCKTDIDLECRSVKDQKHLALNSVKDIKAKRTQKKKLHTVEIAAMKTVINNQKQWTKWENAWRKKESERPRLNDLSSHNSHINLNQTSFLEKTIAQKMEKLVEKVGLEEEDLFEYLVDFPNRQREFKEAQEESEARLEEVTKELKYVTKELADYRSDLRQASTKKLSELENKLSLATTKFNDKNRHFREQEMVFENLQGWANEMMQRLVPLGDDGPRDVPASDKNEDPFVAKLRALENKLAALQYQTELKSKAINLASEAGSPIVGDEFTRKVAQPDAAMASPALGQYNIRVPTSLPPSPKAEEDE